MKLYEFTSILEEIAPKSLALDFDNVGLLIGTTRTDINRVLIALDLTLDVVNEAIALGADMVVTHHPTFFHGVKHMLPDDPDTAAPFALIQNNIAHFAMHTNLDAAEGGVNTALCKRLGITNTSVVGDAGICRLGDLTPAKTLRELCLHTEKELSCVVRFGGDPDMLIKKAVVIGGSGGECFELAKRCGANILITGEIDHHEAIAAITSDIAVIQAGHYETEAVVLYPLMNSLQNRAPLVQYSVANTERSPLRGI